MIMVVGNTKLDNILKSKVGDGKCILFKYGKGSGGDFMLKQFLSENTQETYSVYLSTYESEDDIRNPTAQELPKEVEVISLMEMRKDESERVKRKDRFVWDDLLVTELMGLSNPKVEKRRTKNPADMMLACITEVAHKQVLPFRIVLDSVMDLFRWAPEDEVIRRIGVLKESLGKYGGYALIGAPLEWGAISHLETTLFDAVIEARADRKSEVWERTLTLCNVRNRPDPPEEWPISVIKDIPGALPVE